MTTSRINAYRWPARLVSHKPFAAERYFITSSSIWQVFFAENYDFSFLFSLFCQWPHFLCKMHNPGAFCRWKTPPRPFAASVWAGKAGVIPILLYKRTPSVKACRLCQLSPQASSPSQALTRQTPPFVTCGDIFPRSGGSLSSKGEPLAKPVTWHLSRKLYRHAKVSPFGRGGCERSEQTERARLLPAAPPLPQEAGAANAIHLYDPTREKANRENPQIFPIGKFKIILP